MDYGDEFNDDEESAYKKEKIGEMKGRGILKNTKKEESENDSDDIDSQE